MYVYTVVYTPTPLVTRTCYIRHFTSEEVINAEQYKALVSLKSNILHEFHCWGEVKSFDIHSLFKSTENLQFDFHHDLSLPLEKKEEYLAFVRDTVDIERRRPTFDFKHKNIPSSTGIWESFFTGSSQEKVHNVVAWEPENPFECPCETTDPIHDFNISAKGKWIIQKEQDMWNNVPQILFACNFFSEKCTQFLPIWKTITDTPHMEFLLLPSTSEYRICDLPKEFTTPHLFWRTGPTWTPYTGQMTQEAINVLMRMIQNHDSTIMYELSNGMIIQETDKIPISLLGTSVFPDLQIVASLTLQRGLLTLKRGTDKKEMNVSKKQEDALRAIFGTGNFSLEHCFGLWDTSVQKEQSVKDFIIGENQWLTKYRNMADCYSLVTGPYDSDWRNKKVEEYGYLLYLLQQTNSSQELQTLIHDFLKTPVLLNKMKAPSCALAVLSLNVKFMTYVGKYHDSGCVELCLLLELLKFPIVESEWKWAKLKVFQFVTKVFQTRHLERIPDEKIASSALWEYFQKFLKGNMIDHILYHGNQQEFNDCLKGLGWEQKRISSGKVWINAQYTKGKNTDIIAQSDE